MKKTLMVALVAGAASSCLAQTDNFGPLPFGGEIRVDAMPPNPYGSRDVVQIVYDCLSNSFGNGSATHLGSCVHILEDVSVVPGPMAGDTTPDLTEMTWGVGSIGTAPLDGDFVMAFWNANDVNWAGFTAPGASMINPAARPFEVFRVALTSVTNGFYWQYTSSLTGFNGGVGITLPTSAPGTDCYVEAVWLNPGAEPGIVNDDPTNYPVGGVIPQASFQTYTNGAALVFGSNSGAAMGGNAASPGTTVQDYGRDQETNVADVGWFVGAATAASAGTPERRYIAASPARGYMLRFRGNVPPPPPPSFQDLGCISDGVTTVNDSIADNTVKFYKIQLCNGASAQDCLDKFLDVTTSDGSGVLNPSVGMYDETGALLAANDDGGNLLDAQLSFGIGQRAGNGDGQNFDGRDGELGSGNYYLAVAPSGSGFGGGFTVTPAGTGGSFAITLNTNANNGAAFTLAAPFINGVNYNDVPVIGTGPIIFDPNFPDLRQGLGQGTGLKGVLWSRFDLSGDASASSGSYLDIEFGRLSTPSADGVAYLFNSNGDIVAFSDDEGPRALPMFSFGDTSTPRTYPPEVEVYQGGNGDLPAGTYYMASALWATQDADACFLSNDRFHVRGTSGSNLTLGADLYAAVNAVGCQVTCDYNQDGGADTSDVIDLANDIASGVESFPGSCSDFNQDGGADTSDVIDLANAIASGSC